MVEQKRNQASRLTKLIAFYTKHSKGKGWSNWKTERGME